MENSINQSETNTYYVNSQQFAIHEQMLNMIGSYRISQCIFAATQLGIADLLKDGPKHCDDLAIATDTHNDSLYRLLKVLVSVGIFAEIQPGYFQLNSLATCLQDNEPNTLRNFILLEAEYYYSVWDNLIYTLHTGKSAFEHLHGMTTHQYITQKPALAKIFDLAMRELSARHDAAFLAAYDFSSKEKIVDVGGGEGSLLVSLIHRYSTLKGILFEQPYVIEKAKILFEKEEIISRCEFMPGDFFEESVPVGADAYLNKNVLNDWDDQRAIKILQNCHQAMEGRGQLLVMQRIRSTETSLETNLLEINKLLMRSVSVRIRTKEELHELFKSAGFKLTQIIPTETEMSIIEGKPLISCQT